MVTRLLVPIICLAVLASARCQKAPVQVGIEFRLAEAEPASGLTEMTFALTGETFYVHDEAVLSNKHVESAAVSSWQGRDVVEILLTDAGSERLARFTRANVGRRIAMLVDDVLISAPVIRAPITGGRAIIDGRFSNEEAQRVAQGMMRR
jgi:preprotein translocase subunit SecD